jgi:hypothetical protein
MLLACATASALTARWSYIVGFILTDAYITFESDGTRRQPEDKFPVEFSITNGET